MYGFSCATGCARSAIRAASVVRLRRVRLHARVVERAQVVRALVAVVGDRQRRAPIVERDRRLALVGLDRLPRELGHRFTSSGKQRHELAEPIGRVLEDRVAELAEQLVRDVAVRRSPPIDVASSARSEHARDRDRAWPCLPIRVAMLIRTAARTRGSHAISSSIVRRARALGVEQQHRVRELDVARRRARAAARARSSRAPRSRARIAARRHPRPSSSSSSSSSARRPRPPSSRRLGAARAFSAVEQPASASHRVGDAADLDGACRPGRG